MNAEINVNLRDDDDSEKAEIKIRSFGCVSELRFEGRSLNAVANIDPVDIRRLLEAFKLAEQKRIAPDAKTIEALEYITDRFDYCSDDQSRLHITCEFEMPIAGCGAIRLEPILDWNKGKNAGEKTT